MGAPKIEFDRLPREVQERVALQLGEQEKVSGGVVIPLSPPPALLTGGIERVNALPSEGGRLERVNGEMGRREAWLERAVEALRPTLTFAGEPRVSVGFPSKGALSRKGASHTIGQCWHGEAAADGIPQVYISPLIGDPVEVLAILLHELIHFKLGPGAKHGKRFRAQMELVGLEGKPTATIAGTQLRFALEKKVADLGEYPHAALDPKTLAKKQVCRQLKAKCPACDAIIRLSKEAAGRGLPICGSCCVELEEPNEWRGERMVLCGVKGGEE